MSDSNMILNPKTNRYVKRSSQTGKRLLKELASPPPQPIIEAKLPEPTISEVKLLEPEPVQKAMIETGLEIVEKNQAKFIGLTSQQTDALFKKLLLERLSIKEKPKKVESKKHRFKVVQPSSESESETD